MPDYFIDCQTVTNLGVSICVDWYQSKHKVHSKTRPRLCTQVFNPLL